MRLRPEVSSSWETADASELVVNDAGAVLGEIDELTAKSACIPAGVINMNVGALRHICELHAGQIQRYALSEIAEFVSDVVSGYEQVYEGTDGSVLLVKAIGEHNAVVAVGYFESGIYRVKTAGIRRKRGFKNKKLLFSKQGANP